MGDFFSGLLGGVSNIIGGLIGQQTQEDVAQQNIRAAQQMASNRIQWTVADAKAAGINPITALGAQTFTPPSIQTGNSLGEGIAASGQDFGRAVGALMDKPSREQQLREDLLSAQIDQVRADTTHQQFLNAKAAVNIAQPGTGPGVPLPRADPRYEPDIKPAFQRFQTSDGVVVAPSRPFTESSFSSIPGIPASLDVAGQMVGLNDASPRLVRPDFARYFEDVGEVLGR